MKRATLIELPPALCVNNAPSLAALVARDEATMALAKLYVGKNFDFTGSPAASFTLLQMLTRFAWHGTLSTDYSADTLTIDLECGTSIQLDGPDLILDEVTPFDALANTVLIFIGNEILSLAGATLTAAGAYKIFTVRGRFGTLRQFHAVGSEVFIMRLDDLAPVNLPSLKSGNIGQFKLVRGVDNLAEQEAFSVGFNGGAWQLPPPAQVTVDGMLTPLVDSGTDLVIAWKLPAAGLPGKTVSTLLEFIVPGEAIVSVLVPWPTVTLTKAWAGLPAAATDGFTLRASTQVDDGDNLITGPNVQVFVNVIGGAGGSLAPVIDSIVPTNSAYSDGYIEYTIYGSGFIADGAAVIFLADGSSAPITFLSATEVRCQWAYFAGPMPDGTGSSGVRFDCANGSSNIYTVYQKP